jgi:hypothetical protein
MMQASDALGWLPLLAILAGILSVMVAMALRHPRWLLRSTAFSSSRSSPCPR